MHLNTSSLHVPIKKASNQKKWTFYHLLYFLAVGLVIGCKFFFDESVAIEQLNWLLLPTIGLVELFTNLTFYFDSEFGYISTASNPIIVDYSCAGLRYLSIAFVMAVFTFLSNFKQTKAQILAFVAFALSSYLLTIWVNSCRIIGAIFLLKSSEYVPILGSPMAHLMEGICCYFVFLIAYYWSLQYACNKLLKKPTI